MLRQLKFIGVGAICLFVQLLLLSVLERYIPSLLANGLGFIVSAQLNFVLSYTVTWGDSERRVGWLLVVTWLRFMLSVLLSLGINSLLFGLVHYARGAPSLVAALLATAISTACTFLINHYLVFRPQRGV